MINSDKKEVYVQDCSLEELAMMIDVIRQFPALDDYKIVVYEIRDDNSQDGGNSEQTV